MSVSHDSASEASKFLLDLAHGKYADELAVANRVLVRIGTFQPWALIVKQALDTLVMINSATAPLQVMPDGKGGWVPTTNSRIGPDGNFL